MAQHRWSSSPTGDGQRVQGADLDFSDNTRLYRDSQPVNAPELDDEHHTLDQTTLCSSVPSEFRRDPAAPRQSRYAYRDSHTDVSDGVA